MNKPIEIINSPYTKAYGPLVRYSDHCAALEEKEQLRANAVKRCDELLKELERMALLCEEQATQLRNDDLAKLEKKIHARDMIGRWDGKPKAL